MTGICSANAADGYRTVSPAEFEKEAKADPSAVIVDVRTPAEYAEGHIAGAIDADWLDPAAFDAATARFDTAHTYYVYCRSGGRSAQASEALQQRGLRVVDLDGGILNWTEHGLPVTR